MFIFLIRPLYYFKVELGLDFPCLNLYIWLPVHDLIHNPVFRETAIIGFSLLVHASSHFNKLKAIEQIFKSLAQLLVDLWSLGDHFRSDIFKVGVHFGFILVFEENWVEDDLVDGGLLVEVTGGDDADEVLKLGVGKVLKLLLDGGDNGGGVGRIH